MTALSPLYREILFAFKWDAFLFGVINVADDLTAIVTRFHRNATVEMESWMADMDVHLFADGGAHGGKIDDGSG